MPKLLPRWMSRYLLAAALVGMAPLAHANLVEQLLALPAIQNLLNRVPELQALAQQCGNPAYRQRNIEPCQRADQAAALSRMPPQLRALMANPVMANSLRELCVAAVGTGRTSYLCVELSKADAQFLMRAREREAEINRESPG